jgi:hypothetical protein
MKVIVTTVRKRDMEKLENSRNTIQKSCKWMIELW